MKISKVNSTARLCGGIYFRISRIHSFIHLWYAHDCLLTAVEGKNNE